MKRFFKKFLWLSMLLIIIISSSYVLAIDKYNVVHGYLYDNCSSTDYGIFNNPLAIAGNPTTETIIQNSGCNLDGSGDYLRNITMNISDVRTISYWVKPSGITNSYQFSITSNAWGSNQFAPQFQGGAKTHLLYWYQPTTTQILAAQNVVTTPNNTISLVTYVLNGTHLVVYINGTYSYSYASTLTTFGGGTYFSIGSRAYDVGEQFKGVISNFNMFNYPFNDVEVLDILYNNGSGRDWRTYNSTATIYIPPSTTIINECNQTYTYSNTIDTLINLTWNISNGSNILYDLYLSTTQPVTANSYEYNSINDTNITISLQEIITELGFDDEYFYNIDACDEINCSTTRLNMESVCKFYICKNNYIRSDNYCFNNFRLINYSDSNNCPLLLDFPASNNTYEECLTPPTQGEINITNGLYALILLLMVYIGFLIKNRRG